jgi:hypothetical protein
MPGFRSPAFDPRFARRRVDRFEDRLENRLRFALLPHFVGGLVPGIPSMIPFGFLGMLGY